MALTVLLLFLPENKNDWKWNVNLNRLKIFHCLGITAPMWIKKVYSQKVELFQGGATQFCICGTSLPVLIVYEYMTFHGASSKLTPIKRTPSFSWNVEVSMEVTFLKFGSSTLPWKLQVILELSCDIGTSKWPWNFQVIFGTSKWSSNLGGSDAIQRWKMKNWDNSATWYTFYFTKTNTVQYDDELHNLECGGWGGWQKKVKNNLDFQSQWASMQKKKTGKFWTCSF